MSQSILETALRYDLDINLFPYSVEVHWYDVPLLETHTFREQVNARDERRAALARCVELAVKKAKQVKAARATGEPK